MKARLKRLIDKLLMRNVTYEMREELGLLRSDMAQALRSLRSLETDVRRINSNVALLMQDVSVGQEGLSDQIMEARRDTHLVTGELQAAITRLGATPHEAMVEAKTV